MIFEILNCKKYEYMIGLISGINSWNVFNVFIIMIGILDVKWYKKKIVFVKEINCIY